LRVVFDTNVVVSALLFPVGRLAWLRALWATGKAVPVVCAETVTELLGVLEYPKFALGAEDRDALLADYLPYAEAVRLPSRIPSLPDCRDPDDLVFLALAVCSKADALVTGDADLLNLASRVKVPVLTPEAFRKRCA
jgi:uncharacterized protein